MSLILKTYSRFTREWASRRNILASSNFDHASKGNVPADRGDSKQ